MPCWHLDLPILENDQTLIDSYLDRSGVSSSIQNGGVRWLADQSIKRHRLLYCKSTQGDCGTVTPPDLSAARDTKLAGLGLGIAGGTGLLGAGLGALGLAGAAAGAATAGLSLIPTVLIGIFTHHAQAVKLEQDTLCDVSSKYNAYAQAIEQAVASGQLTVAGAQQTSQAIANVLTQELQQGYKDCNAYCYYVYCLKATELFAREIVYPKLAQPLTTQLVNEVTKPANLAMLVGLGVAAKILLFR